MTDDAREAQQHLAYAVRYMKDAVLELQNAQRLMTPEQITSSEAGRFESALKGFAFDLSSNLYSTFEQLR